MAENKKGFVLYADLIHTVRKMSKAKAGVLFLTILQYVNDENPVVEDEVIDLVFEPIKRQMKRDLKKYQEIKDKRSAIGKLGGDASAAKRSKSNQTEPIGSFGQANQPVTVTDNVNDNVIKIEKNFEVLESQEIWKDRTMMALQLDKKKFKIAFDAFRAQHIMAGQVKPLSELMDHFSKWYPKAKANLFNNQSPTQTYTKI
jgi:hypothetical protein